MDAPEIPRSFLGTAIIGLEFIDSRSTPYICPGVPVCTTFQGREFPTGVPPLYKGARGPTH